MSDSNNKTTDAGGAGGGGGGGAGGPGIAPNVQVFPANITINAGGGVDLEALAQDAYDWVVAQDEVQAHVEVEAAASQDDDDEAEVEAEDEDNAEDEASVAAAKEDDAAEDEDDEDEDEKEDEEDDDAGAKDKRKKEDKSSLTGQAAEQAAEKDGKETSPRVREMSYASEEWMPGFFGPIRLRVGRNNVIQRRIRAGRMSMLADHDDTKPIGKIISGRVGNDRVAYARVRLAETETAKKYTEEIDAGLRSGTSPGFVVHQVDILGEDDEDYDPKEMFQFDVTLWEPYEISSTPIPRNPNVGLMAANMTANGQMVLANGSLVLAGGEKFQEAMKTEELRRASMADKNTEDAATAGVDTSALEADKARLETENAKLRDEADIRRLGGMAGQVEMAEQHIADGGDATSFRDKLLTVKFQRNPLWRQPMPEAGRFSMSKLLAAYLKPGDDNAKQAAASELRAIHEHNIQPQNGGNFVVPMEYLDRSVGERAAFTSSTAGAAGGTTIQTDVDLERAGQWLIDQAPILQLCETITGLEGNLQIPVVTAGPTVGARAEVSTPADGGGSFDATPPTLTPHRIDTQIQLSMQSIIQTGGWLDSFIRQQLGMGLTQFMSQQVLIGTGTGNQVTGIRVAAGVNEQNYAMADKGKFSHFVLMENEVDEALIPMMRRAYVLQTDLYAKGRYTSVDPGSGIMSIRDGQVVGTPDAAFRTMGMVGGDVPAYKTTLMAANQGVYGEWTEAFVGIWRALEIITDTVTQPGNVKITAIAFWDLALRRPAAFVKTTQA